MSNIGNDEENVQVEFELSLLLGVHNIDFVATLSITLPALRVSRNPYFQIQNLSGVQKKENLWNFCHFTLLLFK